MRLLKLQFLWLSSKSCENIARNCQTSRRDAIIDALKIFISECTFMISLFTLVIKGK